MAAATLWNTLNVRDRGNMVRGSPSLESFHLDTNIWAYLIITCRISVFLSLHF